MNVIISFLKRKNSVYQAFDTLPEYGYGSRWLPPRYITAIEKYIHEHFDEQFVHINSHDNAVYQTFFVTFDRVEDEAFFQVLIADGIVI